MAVIKILLSLSLVITALASPAKPFKTPRSESEDYDDDPLEYFAEQASSFFDDFFKEDKVKISDDIELTSNDNDDDGDDITGRSNGSLEDKIENYMKTHDVTLKLPVGSVKLGAKNLDNHELDVKFKFNDESEVEQARKHKLKKIVSPIVVFFLLKAITLVPLVLGFLHYGSWMALQISGIAFVISAGLSIFQLCKKIAENNAAAHIAAHGPWEAPAHHAAARNYIENNNNVNEAQKMAYSAYDKQK